MHPELTAALATERRRDLAASAAASASAGRRPRTLLPRYKLTWSRTTLAQAAADRGSRSWVIVISATRAL